MSAACGTYAGYQAHKAAGDTPCPECRAANATYTREHRRRTGRSSYTSAAKDRARARARLAKIYPSVYQALLDEERARLREGSS